MTIGKKDPP